MTNNVNSAPLSATLSQKEQEEVHSERRQPKHVVAWDFPIRPSASFYRILLDEFGSSHPGGDCQMIQRSVALCRDDFVASRLAALAEHFGGHVLSFGVAREGFDPVARTQATDYVNRVLAQRRRRRGRR